MLTLALALTAGSLAGSPCLGLNRTRPTPPCFPSHEWYENQNACYQRCPSASGKRDPVAQRCFCDAASPCIPGLECMSVAGSTQKQCVCCGDVASCGGNQQEPTIGPVNPDYEYASEQAVERWHDLKFGLRIHWGLYAIEGIGPESWPLYFNKPAPDEAATQKMANNSCGQDVVGCAKYEAWYYAQAKTWNPSRFNATSWIALMKRAGIKYFDFTAKHCEGFAMYNTSAVLKDCWQWDEMGKEPPKSVPCAKPYKHFSSVELPGFNRDIVGELIGAARAGGIAPGLYFSHADWVDPNLRIDPINPVVQGHVKPSCVNASCDPRKYSRTSNAEQWARGVERHRAQLLEVLTKYGELFELSLDVGLQSSFNKDFNSDMQKTVMMMRALAPNTLFRQRGIGGTAFTPERGYGDYNTPEETFPDKPIPGNWQVIYHGSQFMSYDPVAAHYANGSFIVWHLVDIVAKGGQMQIGYGPDANGQFHPLAVKALEYAGRWLETNGQSIYYTRPMIAAGSSGRLVWNDTASQQVRYTRSKDQATIYATALSGFGSAPTLGGSRLPLADVVPEAGSTITILGYEDGSRTPIAVQWSMAGGRAVLEVPDDLAKHPKIMAPGICFKIRGKPRA